MNPPPHGLDRLQRAAMSLMAILVLVTFFGTNLQAVLWQSSDWLVSTVLPATVVDLTNNERASSAREPLRRNATLDTAAQLKAQHMAENEYFAHYAPDGTSPWYWFDEAGYVYAHAGENLAIHFTDSSQVVDAWMKSPTHRANIVDAKYSEIGVGTAKGTYEGYDTVYVVQLFGTPAVSPLARASEPVETAPATESVEVEVSNPSAPATAPEAVLSETLPVTSVTPPPTSASVPVAVDEPIPLDVNIEPEPIPEPAPAPLPVEPQPESVPIEVTEPLLTESEPERVLTDTVVVEMSLISTSSGLAVAQITTPNNGHAGATVSSLATRPHLVLQIIYVLLAGVVVLLLSTSVVMEARRAHYRQVAYGVLLLFGMGGLWFAHSLLTTGAVIV